jgi:hypothetical protein
MHGNMSHVTSRRVTGTWPAMRDVTGCPLINGQWSHAGGPIKTFTPRGIKDSPPTCAMDVS